MVFLGVVNQFLSFLYCKIVLLQGNILLSTFGQYFSPFKSCFQPFFTQKTQFFAKKSPRRSAKNFYFQNFEFQAINKFIIGVIYKKSQSLTSFFGLGSEILQNQQKPKNHHGGVQTPASFANLTRIEFLRPFIS